VSAVVYGIVHCDTVKKARAWLDVHAVPYRFHDFRQEGVPLAELDDWIGRLGWQLLVNRQGTTWRKLDEATRARVVDAVQARALMRAQPSVIKRPVVHWSDGAVTVGFNEKAFAAHGA
jgi:Spx/MgsR family transcriptional regulator